MNTLKPEKQLAVLSARVEGTRIRGTERMTGVPRETIMRLLATGGGRWQELLAEGMQGFRSRPLQADELWTVCSKKAQRLTEGEGANPALGDQSVFVALDAETQMIPLVVVGRRDPETAHRFLHALRQRPNGNGRIQVPPDGFRAHRSAVASAFGNDGDSAQWVRRDGSEPAGDERSAPPRVTETVSTPIPGNPDPRYISTSYLERQNLTIRMMCRRFTRLTNAFSKKLANLKAALAPHSASSNSCRIHQASWVTPTMAAGGTDRLGELEELLG